VVRQLLYIRISASSMRVITRSANMWRLCPFMIDVWVLVQFASSLELGVVEKRKKEKRK
jgi:hypothetical protein